MEEEERDFMFLGINDQVIATVSKDGEVVINEDNDGRIDEMLTGTHEALSILLQTLYIRFTHPSIRTKIVIQASITEA